MSGAALAANAESQAEGQTKTNRQPPLAAAGAEPAGSEARPPQTRLPQLAAAASPATGSGSSAARKEVVHLDTFGPVEERPPRKLRPARRFQILPPIRRRPLAAAGAEP